MDETGVFPPLEAEYAPADEALAVEFLSRTRLPPEAEARIDATSRTLIEAIREPSTLGSIEDLLHEYSLSTKEGVALMMLAEALLRVPDDITADRLIEDKLTHADWASHELKSDALLISASSWALAVAARIARPDETPRGVLQGLTRRLGLPALRNATRRAIGIVGTHFVLGETIEEAIAESASREGRLYRYSFDMLGEGARTHADAEKYFEAYAHAIGAIAKQAGNAQLPARPGISVKLSALHPRYEAISREKVLRELTPRVLELARMARSADLNFTIDAEEADRLELSLDVMAGVVRDASLAGWDGFGLAIQAYQKRAREVIDWTHELAEHYGRRFMVRLVKGAYWDTEIKRAQERGLADYPVFTRKSMTDLSFLACAQKLLAVRERLYPQIATHNALTVATVIERAGGTDGYEFQRLHGMGEELYEKLLEMHPDAACRTYAPVGTHKDLLAYLVRRLLENGANSSFVARVADPAVPLEELLERPRDRLSTPALARHPDIPLPADLFRPQRPNSSGVEFGDASALDAFLAEIQPHRTIIRDAAPLIDGKPRNGTARACKSPIDGQIIGACIDASDADVAAAVQAATAAFPGWDHTPASVRAAALDRAADLMEAERGALIAVLQAEGGKTLDDCLSEIREAADFCRFYAAGAREHFGREGRILPGPTGEENLYRYRGRGPFVCISPWNFPLAIFTGQIAAALAAGNTVLAKPAEQTPLVAHLAVQLMHSAGIPASALHLVTGDGRAGAALVDNPATAGVAFTGSTEVAWKINRALAGREAAIVPLIAETGGINAMIVDATALPEQVTDDVVTSAFRSAGQRCSALRLLCLQESVADRTLDMIIGAAKALQIGDPRDLATHVGPVIDEEARGALHQYLDNLPDGARILYAGERPEQGTFMAPHIVDLRSVEDLDREVFGPVLHVVRWSPDPRTNEAASGLDRLLEAIEAKGYGLTLGIHSRIDETVAHITRRMRTGNIYVNRSMIGAVVGSQPFGGNGLSGTGPKAGGPDYLARFALEQVISTNTAAAGGDVSLIAGARMR